MCVLNGEEKLWAMETWPIFFLFLCCSVFLLCRAGEEQSKIVKKEQKYLLF